MSILYVLLFLFTTFIYPDRKDRMELGYTQIGYQNYYSYGLALSYNGVIDSNSDFVLGQALGVMSPIYEHEVLYPWIMISLLHRKILTNENMFYDWGVTGNFHFRNEPNKVIPVCSPEIGGGFLFPDNFFRIKTARFALGYNILEGSELFTSDSEGFSLRMDVHFIRGSMDKD